MFGNNKLNKLLDTHFRDYYKIYPNPFKLENWVKINMPKVYQELYDLGWNLNDEETWLETVFVGIILSDKLTNIRTGIYLTNSLQDYQRVKKILNTKAFQKFRQDFKLHNQVIILTCAVSFLSKDDLRSILSELENNYSVYFYDLDPYNDDDELLDDSLEYLNCERNLTPEEIAQYKELIKFDHAEEI